MKYQRVIRTAVCAVCSGIAICLAGCGISFCGIQFGGKDELVFSCEEHPAEETEPMVEEMSLLPENEQESLSVSGQTEETKTSSVRPESSDEQEHLSDQPNPMETEQISGILEDSGADGRVNINSAGVEELMTLNGIGETRAKAIVEYRTQNGTFTKEEDIMLVPGIKEGIFSKIQDQIAVD